MKNYSKYYINNKKQQPSVIFILVFFIFHFSLFVFGAFADECLQYKTNPNIQINIPQYSKNIRRTPTPVAKTHGNIIASLSEDFEISVDLKYTPNGVCVVLKSIDASIGYADFLIQIDSRYASDSCTYSNILAHENKHLEIYLSVIDDYKNEIFNAFESASESIAPVFVSNQKLQNAALDEINKKLQSHPQIILLRQKIQTEQELRNKKFDQENNKNIPSC